jgi:hypothetical protein
MIFRQQSDVVDVNRSLALICRRRRPGPFGQRKAVSRTGLNSALLRPTVVSADVGCNEEKLMRKYIAGLMALALALVSVSALSCPGEKAKDGKGEMSTPSKPKT